MNELKKSAKVAIVSVILLCLQGIAAQISSSTTTALPTTAVNGTSIAGASLDFSAGLSAPTVQLSVTPLRTDALGTIPGRLLNASSHNYTTHLVTSSAHGPAFVVRGTSIVAGNATATASTQCKPSICQCKLECWLTTWCVALSSTPRPDGSVNCTFAASLPAQLTADANATYFVFYERLPEKIEAYTFSGANDIYAVPKKPLTFPNADSFCKRLPGFRLAVFVNKDETERFAALIVKIVEPIMVGLRRTSDGGEIWDDGTTYQQSTYSYAYPAGKVYTGRFADEPYLQNTLFVFQDIAATQESRFVCQAYLY